MSVATNHFFATVTDPLFDYLDWSSCDFMQSKQSGGTLIIGSVWKCGKGCCPGRRLRSNIMVILGWIGPESERKKVLVAKPTKFSR